MHETPMVVTSIQVQQTLEHATFQGHVIHALVTTVAKLSQEMRTTMEFVITLKYRVALHKMIPTMILLQMCTMNRIAQAP